MRNHSVLIFIALLCSSCAEGQRGASANPLEDELVECAKPARLKMEPWGKGGTSKACEIADGPFVAAENGYIHLRGQFESGRKAGVWRWYDRNGVVTRTIDYSERAPGAE